ncbi:MAG: hypothetical protein OJJ21_13300 [Ferrovibrio sp.]|uniref:hypothetical protein n=1 Tax=Ferrovibrio sp. TaxID=1917215 RepID=UPI00260DCEFC|nr:hypothetical protein [Ferrovibrio sp.]MCW0234571.1 hypothetical protein [Ferrovibrio sp.]
MALAIEVVARTYILLPALLLLCILPLRNMTLPRPSVSLLAGAILGTLPLLSYWISGRSHPNALAGLVQWNDAAGYFSCARQLVAGAAIDVSCQMRPFYTALFGTFLAAAGGYIQAALFLQALVIGGMAAWFSHVLACRHGLPAGLAAFAALIMFAAQFTLPVLTENAGLLLALSAFLVLFRDGEGISIGAFFAVLLALTTALIARAGALFVIPALLLWSVVYSGGILSCRLRRTAAGICGVVLAIAANFGLIHAFGGTSANAQSNFSYTLYAMTVGSGTYLQVLWDHPEIGQLPGDQLAGAIYDLAKANLLNSPHLFVFGYLRGMAAWIYGWFSFVPVFHLRAMFAALWFLGIWSCLLNRRGEWERLLLLMIAAIAVSSPFLYPFGGSRILAATFPVDALLVGLGCARLFGGRQAVRPDWGVRLATGGALAFVILPLIAAIILLRFPVLSPVSADVSCPAGQKPFVADLARETVAISLVTGGQRVINPLAVSRDGFVKRVDKDVAYYDDLVALPAGTTIVDAMQRRPGATDGFGYGKPLQFLWDGAMPGRQLVQGCLESSGNTRFLRATVLEPAQ